MRPARPGLAALLTCLAMAGFASMDAMSKFLVHDYSIVQILWLRYLVFTGFALAVAGPKVTLRSGRPWMQAGRGALALVENGVFVLAFAYLPLAETHAIAATSPLLVIVLSAVFLHEKADAARWLAVLAGFVGVLTIIRPGFETLRWPMAIPLIGALLWAVYQVQTRLLAGIDRMETTLLWTALSGLVGTSMLVPFIWRPPTALAWLLLGGIATLGTLSHFALIKALDHAPAGALQPYAYTLLVWATMLGVVVFGDVPGIWTMVGAAVVVLGGLYTWNRDRIGARNA